MTDQIPADKVRPILDEWERIKEYADWDDLDTLVKDIRALLPDPPRPTLADMTEEERAACRRMQADVKGEDGSAVIYTPNWKDGSATVLWPSGFIEQADWENVTPRPDLPRMTWPGDAPAPAPAPDLPEGWRLADHREYGRVVVTNTTPSHDGYVAFVRRSDYLNSGHGNDWCKPEELTYLDQEADQ